MLQAKIEKPGAVIEIQEDAYGVSVKVNGEWIAAVDVYHLAEDDPQDEERGKVLTIIYDDDGDPPALIYHDPQEIRLQIDTDRYRFSKIGSGFAEVVVARLERMLK